MSTITIAGPCQNIQRALYPPHSKYFISNEFIGGARVLAQVLSRLFPASKLENDYDEGVTADPALPTRRLRLEPFAAAPALKEQLKPSTQFLRVGDVIESDDPYSVVPRVFAVVGDRIAKRVLVLGGAAAQGKGGSVSDGEKLDARDEALDAITNDLDFVYVLAKSINELFYYKYIITEKLGTVGRRPIIIGQIDVGKLEIDSFIQTDTAYERTVGDICRCLPLISETNRDDSVSGPRPSVLLVGQQEGYDALIIRIGNAACVTITAPDPNKKHPSVKLFCHPERCAPTALPGLGFMLAYDILLCASIIHGLVSSGVDRIAGDRERMISWKSALYTGARVGIQSTYRCFVEGLGIYNQKLANSDKLAMIQQCPGDLFSRFILRGISTEILKSKQTALKFPLIYPKLDYPVSKMPVWEETPRLILKHDVDFKVAHSPNQFWRMVVPKPKRNGHDDYFNTAMGYLRGSKDLPLVKIGANRIVDRLEVEDYLYLQRLLLTYEHDKKRTRPLCIGVFGQPGSGKSFGVNQLINEMSGDVPIFSRDKITVNLSQTMSMNELIETFHRVRDECLKEPIPLVFFDEFDSAFEGRSFGWLKYFLAPMQDGNFSSNGKTYSFGKAVFVFAGGVNHSFSEFNERSRSPDFCDAKGPDFISRLRGTLNIRGLNLPEEDEDGSCYVNMIKRAVFLKYLLEEKIGRGLKGDLIAANVADAFLRIPAFKHGARSLEAILEMSSLSYGETFHLSQLPPRDQLDMHVDSRAFLRLAGVSSVLSNIG